VSVNHAEQAEQESDGLEQHFWRVIQTVSRRQESGEGREEISLKSSILLVQVLYSTVLACDECLWTLPIAVLVE